MHTPKAVREALPQEWVVCLPNERNSVLRILETQTDHEQKNRKQELIVPPAFTC